MVRFCLTNWSLSFSMWPCPITRRSNQTSFTFKNWLCEIGRIGTVRHQILDMYWTLDSQRPEPIEQIGANERGSGHDGHSLVCSFCDTVLWRSIRNNLLESYSIFSTPISQSAFYVFRCVVHKTVSFTLRNASTAFTHSISFSDAFDLDLREAIPMYLP